GKGQVDLRIHRDLVDPVQLILDGVLAGDDLDVRGIQFGESGVEGRRLAAARWPVTRMMPWLRLMTSRVCVKTLPASPSFSMFKATLDLSKRRMTIDSPCAVGTVETRMSTSLPASLIRIRPS